MLPKKDDKLPPGGPGGRGGLNFNAAISAALRRELGPTHQAVKTVMSWTGASESTVKTWLIGSHGPSGEHLVALARNSDEVLRTFLLLADRTGAVRSIRLAALRTHLIEALQCLDEWKE